MILKNVLLGSALVLVSGNLLAANATERDIIDFRVAQTGKAVVSISGADVNPNNCAQSNLTFDDSDSSYKVWLAQLLTAQAAGMKVTFSIVDDECAFGTNPKIQNIRLISN